jgi:serine/threonine protein kinase
MADEALFQSTPYQFLGRIGQGAMGTVFLVRHRETLARCVVKVIHRQLAFDEKTRDRFRLEVQSLGRLDHPHIVAARGTGTTADRRPFVVLEYLQGKTLHQVLQEERLNVGEALEFARQLLLALEAAHRAGVVHRDLKPSNIFLVERHDGVRIVKVLDFGLAKVLPQAPTNAPAPLIAPTTAGTIIGTPRYMSPEAATGAGVDERADVYAAALVVYRMLTGRDAFDHHGTDRLLRAQATETPAPPSRWTSTFMSERLNEVILEALGKDPSSRFRHARDFMNALLSCEEDLAACSKSQPFWTMGRLVLLFLGMLSLGILTALELRKIILE